MNGGLAIIINIVLTLILFQSDKIVFAALEKVVQHVIQGYFGVKFGFWDNSCNFPNVRFEFRKWLITVKSVLIMGSKMGDFTIFLISRFVWWAIQGTVRTFPPISKSFFFKKI